MASSTNFKKLSTKYEGSSNSSNNLNYGLTTLHPRKYPVRDHKSISRVASISEIDGQTKEEMGAWEKAKIKNGEAILRIKRDNAPEERVLTALQKKTEEESIK